MHARPQPRIDRTHVAVQFVLVWRPVATVAESRVVERKDVRVQLRVGQLDKVDALAGECARSAVPVQKQQHALAGGAQAGFETVGCLG